MQELYNQLAVRVSSHHDLFSDFLNDILPIGFEETDDGFIIRSEDELETIKWGVEQFGEALQKALKQPIDIEIVLTKEKNSDWVKEYQEGVTPVEIDQFYIYPTWEEPKNGKVNIAIDPALAFGTGHHPTTATCLKAVAKYVKEADEVIDVGCGSGILSIAAMKLGAVADACDTDPISVENSKINATENSVEYRNIWEGSASAGNTKYDVTIANIVADVLTYIANDLKKITKSGGIMVLSGILDKYENKVLKFYQDCELIERIPQDEWVTLILKRG
ncbi:50S ribosomal protein L11 methyltransferase [Sulfurimonas sp. HSL-1716]|uniref:50S ribosomal protein L11 methyltransferase n=1 Tax=Hydrocurvibacter sulfurireducens TaxID=3131937 RepID=UPI0031F79719